MKTITVKDVMSWEPCEEYTEERVTELFAGRESLSVMNILDLDIPLGDRFWAVLREELVPAPILHEFACRCAEEALKLVENPDPRNIAAIEAKRKWLRGEITDKELSAARSAANAGGYAAWSAARDAAWYAARDAACSAARSAADAAWYAADAARSAARDAAWYAARDAAWEKQISILKELLEARDDT